MAHRTDDTSTLERDFATAGLDPTGIDLAWLARIRTETEEKMAAYRATTGFVDAEPAFNPPEQEQR
jgi:hypothetical protein